VSVGSPDNEERRLLAEYETTTHFYSQPDEDPYLDAAHSNSADGDGSTIPEFMAQYSHRPEREPDGRDG
jgi:hypothetical protein